MNVAYRLLGSVAESEDAVQEAYTRWYALPPGRQDEIASPGAWLTTVTGRICLDVLGSARARRERYVGAWLPDPLPDHSEWRHGPGADLADPADQMVLDESVTMAFLVVLESMTPAERVAFVLHDVFRYPFAEIAAVLGRTSAACKQLAASARRRVRAARAPVSVAAAGRADAVRQVKEAWENQDIAALVDLLDPAAVMTADGGGLAGAALRPIEGGARIAQYMVAIADKAPGLELLERSVNGAPGLVGPGGGGVLNGGGFDKAARRRPPLRGGPPPAEQRPGGP
ncbi:sigma-70 family RNA polymerase sigma factor, partial [Streptomyces parvus]|uniref:sigma-70 family RNA polymerase sigma factor n=1 Tax=Streptomyces parvus TaxID=66428 RepID=UPI00363DDF48